MFVAPESRTTCISHRRPEEGTRRHPGRASGVTLMELLVAILVMSLVTVVLLILTMSTGRSLVEMVNYVDLDHYNRVAMDMMTRDLRQVQYLKTFNTNVLTFVDKDGGSLEYAYSPVTRTLTRTKSGQNRVLLDNCDQLQFSIYQRTPMSNKFEFFPVTGVTNAKVVRVVWNCSRKLFGRRVNTEQGQTSRIVIRNKKEI
jgi:Tfp pilus assembly protein PilW